MRIQLIDGASGFIARAFVTCLLRHTVDSENKCDVN